MSRKISFFEMIKDTNRKDFFEATPQLVQSWKSKVTNHFERNGLEIKIESIQKTGLDPGWLPAAVLTQT